MEFQIWAERYRPAKLSEIINQKHAVERIKAFVKEKNIPHMLFAGKQGTGKTTTALCIARELYGNSWRQNILELNASDSRGIDIIRGQVKDFARMKPLGDVPWKMIILDEADALTQEAQQALRRTMENYTHVTRFVLLCVSPDTKVVLPEEIETTIEKLKERKNTILSLDTTNNSFEQDEIIGFIETDPKKIGKNSLSIKTNTGRELKLTEDHPLLTEKGWKLAGDLKKDDLVVTFPYLENTLLENNLETIIDKDDFSTFIEKYEIRYQNRKPINDAKRFSELATRGKKTIINIILKLFNEFILTNRGLTSREEHIIEIIKNNPHISRKEIQNKIKLSRIRVVQLLKSLEKKDYIERIIDKENSKIHYFIALNRKSLVLRNKMDIKRVLKENFGLEISYTEVKRIIEGKPIKGTLESVIKELEGRNLLPLTYSNPKIGVISRLAGVLLGDGHLTNVGRTLIFTSNEEMLREIQNDIYKLGFSPGKIRKHEIKNENFKGRIISGTTTNFRINSIALWTLFSYLGVPAGDKVDTAYEIPKWVRKGTKFVKREFLRAFFDCESSTPKIKKHNFEAISLVQHKTENKLKYGDIFMQQIKDILKEFDVETYSIKIIPTENRKDDTKVYSITLTIRASNKNMLNFFKYIGFFYEFKKRIIGRIAQEYLRYKTCLIEEREKLAQKILVDISNGKSIWETSREFGCTPDFICDRIEGKEIGVSYKSLLSFGEWKERYWIKNSELVWNKIEDIKTIDLNKVVDITTKNLHTFVSNGLISHNCNYSSKIIEPIQSRCAVFRFKSLADGDIKKYIDRIVDGEKLKIDEKAIETLVYLSEGDLRKVSNLLQASASMKEKITEDVVYDIASKAKPTDVKEMLEMVLKGKFMDARKKLQELLLRQGLSGSDIVTEIHRQIYSLDNMPENKKVQLIEKCGEFEFRISEGGNELIQLEALLASFLPLSEK